jgi:hypothetical protein
MLAFVLPLLAIFWVSLLPYVQAPSWQALSTLTFERYSMAAFDSAILGNDEYRALIVAVPT